MASLRMIKKDIDFLASEIISDCWVYMYINPEEKTDQVVAIINDAVILRNELIDRVNSRQIENAKKHYKAINQDLLKGVDALFMRISALIK